MFHVERMEQLQSCPACGQSTLKPYLTCIDYTVSKKEFKIDVCTACTFKFTNPRPTASEIGYYYDSPDYISHSNSRKGLVNLVYQLVRQISLNRKIKLVKSLNLEGKQVLDIGSGTGEFLKKTQDAGFDVIGIEPNSKARDYAIKNHKLKIYQEFDLDSIPPASKDLITMWHVLEHVHLLQDRIKQIKTILKPNGYAIIAVPNYTSWDAKHYGVIWASYDVPRHLYHFSPLVMKQLFHRNKMEHVRSLPLRYDSYYVSLLSSKYKKETFPLFKAVKNGFRSNRLAKGNPELFSSVIYVFKNVI